ncbi:MAG: peptidoglycan-binding domain-containing protein [Gammaproteobacteria bacterium]|nr:peptidoglycan-binding domain-containing protein [Gammaproteobacteria bacterium]
MKKSFRATLIGAAVILATGVAVVPVTALAQMPANPCSSQAAGTMKTTKKMHTGMAASARVKAIQEALNKAGAMLKVDGKMGMKTRAALKEFQSKHGLKATGYANKATLKALDVK